jgi:type III pantothenate kinase
MLPLHARGERAGERGTLETLETLKTPKTPLGYTPRMPSDRLLAVDVGNTSVVLGLWEGAELRASWRLTTLHDRTADEYGILARELLADAAAVDAAIVASVVPPLNGTIASMLSRYFGVDALFVEPGVKTGLSIRTENPLEVGADRIANAVAAHHRFGGPTIVVDFGTATTFDLVTEAGEYLGGIIAPGFTISSEALFARAARLPRVDFKRPAQLIGANTVASIQSGIYFGYLGLIDGVLARMKEEISGVRAVVATGSLERSMIEESRFIGEWAPDLTLQGLKLIHDRNARRKERRAR